MFLSEELLQEIHERAPRYDKENAWPAEDYAALKEAGYLKAFVPKEYGGFGLSLKEIAQEQTRLAMAAPGTALGVNMHQIIVGLGKHMVRFGNKKGEQILRDAAEGKLLAFGISEPSNDRVLFGSISEARPEADGAYRFYGKKVFLSMRKYRIPLDQSLVQERLSLKFALLPRRYLLTQRCLIASHACPLYPSRLLR